MSNILQKIVNCFNKLEPDECILIYDISGNYILITSRDSVHYKEGVLEIISNGISFYVEEIVVFAVKQYNRTYDYVNNECRNYKINI